MKHDVVVVGAGYAGLMAAKRIAGQLRPSDADVTLVNASDRFVERVRLHQLAAGQTLTDHPLVDLLDGTGVSLVVGRATSIDPARREVHVRTGDEVRRLRYDKLVYALGSQADTDSVDGVAEHAHTVASERDALAFRGRVAALAAAGGAVAVVGGGATGIEAAAELAETYPGLTVRLVTGAAPGAWLSPRAQSYLRTALDRLGVDVRTDARVRAVRDDGVILSDGSLIGAAATLWATGFRVPTLARDAGLEVDTSGRVVVDRTLRSTSHPDVYAVGDAAVADGPGDRELRMACATGIPMGVAAANAVTAVLTDRKPRPLRFRYVVQNLSLGRRDGVIQFVHADDSPRHAVLTGRAAARFKESVVRLTVWYVRHPMTYGRPVMRRGIVALGDRAPQPPAPASR
jgi:NADH dehydrogenase FAD-containing subunit